MWIEAGEEEVVAGEEVVGERRKWRHWAGTPRSRLERQVDELVSLFQTSAILTAIRGSGGHADAVNVVDVDERVRVVVRGCGRQGS